MKSAPSLAAARRLRQRRLFLAAAARRSRAAHCCSRPQDAEKAPLFYLKWVAVKPLKR